MPAPAPDFGSIPTPAAAARDILPGVRIAAREKYGPVRRAVIGPFLPIIIQLIVEFVVPWLMDLLKKKGDVPLGAPTLLALSKSWERERDPAVAVAMMRVARGETGE